MPQDCCVRTSVQPDAPLTLRESAAFLKCSQRTIHRLVQRQQLRSYSVGDSPRFLIRDLLKAMGPADGGAA